MDAMSFAFKDRRAGRVESLNDYKAFGDDVDMTVDEADANVVTSVMQWDPLKPMPVLDLDVPIEAVPSTTRGHFHLYIDRPMHSDQLFKLLDVMCEVGLLEPGYVEAAKIRGYTSVRLPHVKKPPRGIPVDELAVTVVASPTPPLFE